MSEQTRIGATRSSANTEPQLLLESGPMMLRDFNPRAVLRFQGRKCTTCQGEIMDHWLRSGSSEYWCFANQNQFSDGIDGGTVDIPEGFGDGLRKE